MARGNRNIPGELAYLFIACISLPPSARPLYEEGLSICTLYCRALPRISRAYPPPLLISCARAPLWRTRASCCTVPEKTRLAKDISRSRTLRLWRSRLPEGGNLPARLFWYHAIFLGTAHTLLRTLHAKGLFKTHPVAILPAAARRIARIYAQSSATEELSLLARRTILL